MDQTGPEQIQCKSRVTVNTGLSETTEGEAEQHGAAAADRRDDSRSEDTPRCSEQRGYRLCFNILLSLSDILTSDIISVLNSEVCCSKQFAEKSSDYTWLCLVVPAHLSLSFPALILFTSGK
ncbi:hypothetical protein ILYODFUR_000871 [Ilyodon furcidens]|uniref:Uncharacterized protein n=1 Tax=Ilyodon furcidens TaxID=33524 RepID=A0ABV0T5L9_9TELE